MTKKVVTAKVTSTLRSVCKSMLDNNIGCVVILNSTLQGVDPVGIITERDVVKLVSLIDGFNPEVPIRSFMATPLVTANPTMTLFNTMQIMRRKNIRRLPIIEKSKSPQKLVGIITEKDIAKAIEKSRKKSEANKRITRVRHVTEEYKLPTQI